MSARVFEVARRLSRNGQCNPVERHNFVEAIGWIGYEDWDAIHDAFHRHDDAEFGRLLAEATHRYWMREAVCA